MDLIQKEITARSIFTKSNLPDADYVINPYIGCSHRCVYCYARFMKRFTGHKEPWGQFIDIKVNAPDLVPKNTERYRGKSFFMSSITDPYNEAEKTYQLSRKILEKLRSFDIELSIQTKSSLILRDMELIKEQPNCKVGLTITSLDDRDSTVLEEGAALASERLNTLKTLHGNGIDTYVFMGPILPFITDWQAIIETTKDYVNCFMFENANLYGSIRHDVLTAIDKHYPHLKERYSELFQNAEQYWLDVEDEIVRYCQNNQVEYKMYFHHKKMKKNS